MSGKIILLLLSFLAGVLIGDIWFRVGVALVILLVMILVSLWWEKLAWFCSLALVFGYTLSFFTLLRFSEERTDIGTMVGWDGHQHTILGTVGSLVSSGEFSHRYRVKISEIDKKSVKPFSIALILPPNLSLKEGEVVSALGKFDFPEDTDEYMAEKQLWNGGMIAEFHSFHTEKFSPQNYSLFVRIREWFDQKLTEIFPKEGHDILSGIILGQKNDFDPELKQYLKSSGLMHIMVVSGGNVIMLIIFLGLFIRFFHPWIRIALVTLTIASFTLLVGGDAPVWRAALMGVIGYSASLWGYRFAPLLLPFAVAVILSCLNPLSLVYDIGLQLSFLSVICIIVFGKKLTKMFHFLGSFFDEAMAMTVAATIGTFPITVFYFGTFSLVGPLANLFAAPAIPILMYGGIATLFASTFSASFAYYIGYIPWVASTYLMQIITFFGGQSWSLFRIELGHYRAEFMMMSMCMLLCALVFFSTQRRG